MSPGVARPSRFDVAGIVAVLAALLVGWMHLSAHVPVRTEVPLRVDPDALAAGFRDGVEWHGIYREGHKVGFARLQRRQTENGYILEHRTELDTGPTLGRLAVEVVTELSEEFELHRFDATATGIMGTLRAVGQRTDRGIRVEIFGLQDQPQQVEFDLAAPPVFDFSLAPMLMRRDLQPGDRFRFTHFDPSTMASADGVIEYLGPDTIDLMGQSVATHHLRQEVAGQKLQLWVNDLGEVLREELPGGLIAVRETEAQATFDVLRKRVQSR